MTNAKRLCVTVALVGLVAATALAQSESRGPGEPNQPVPTSGVWPTPRMLDLILGHIAEGMRSHYNMDDSQVMATSDLLKAKFPGWLETNRGELQGLVNWYLETILSDQAPTPEEVAQWARRIEPLAEQFLQLTKETAGEMETYLTDEQRVTLQGEVAVLELAFRNFRGRIENWKNGGFDAETEWPGGNRFPATRRRQEQDFEKEAEETREAVRRYYGVGERINRPAGESQTGASADASADEDVQVENPKRSRQPAPAGGAAAKDEWVKYTEAFIQRYKLVEDQRIKANAILKQFMDERDRYLRRKLAEIMAFETRLKKADEAHDEVERAKVKADYDRVARALDNMFQRLKSQLDRLPTRKQRTEAAKETLAKPEKAEKAEPKPKAPPEKAP